MAIDERNLQNPTDPNLPSYGEENQSLDNTEYTNDPESIRGADDFTIEYVKLYPWNGAEPLDLTNVRIEINIFEDIFNNFISGNISLMDTWDLTTLFPLIGEERLEISFYRPGTKKQPAESLFGSLFKPIYPDQQYQEISDTESYKMSFRVVKLTNRKTVRDKAQYYVLHFTSPELIVNKKKKVRLAYKKKLYSDIVDIVYKGYFASSKPLEIEPTMFEQDFAISNWTPSQTINIICSRSIPVGRAGSSYVFYETIKGFHFVSLEKLFEQEPKEVLLFQWSDVYVSPLNKAIDEEVRNVHDYDFVDYYDVLSNLQHGMYASKLLTYDPVRQRYFEYDFDYMKEFDKQKHLEANKLCTDGLDALGEPYMARFNVMGTNKDHDKIPWIAGKEPGIMPTQIEKYILQRQSQFQQIQNVRLALTLPGNSERKAGNVIEFALPNAMGWPQKYGDEPEKYLSGKYLITAIRHRLQKDAYFHDIEIVKDSFKSEIEYLDPVPLYIDAMSKI
jgi:hypothetical protein